MEKSTIIGVGAGFACIVISILIGEGGALENFVDLPSVFIVFGGTLCAAMASFPGSVLRNMGNLFKLGMQKKKIDLRADVEMVVDLANTARREGLLALENMGASIGNPFLKKGILLIVDGTDSELVKSILEDEILYLQERHSQGQKLFESMSSYAPAFGMIGTLIGLINMLQSLSDTESLGPNMSVALITTFYGVMLANLLFSPMARKLSAATSLEVQEMELLLIGILAIQDGANPRIIRERLNAFIARKDLPKSSVQPNSAGFKSEVEDVES